MEELIINFIKNLKKYLYAILGLILGILFIEYGFIKTVFVFLLIILCYNFGDENFLKKIKKELLNKMK